LDRIRLGVLGGTFDPIHLGHLHIAYRSERLFGLSRIHFVVASSPPHKPKSDLTSFHHRYAMVTLATCGFPSFVPSLAELEPPPSPYSIHTLVKLARGIAGKRPLLYFIAGEDSLQDIANWRDSEELLRSYNFVFVARPGVKSISVSSLLPEKAAGLVRDLRGLAARESRRRIEAEQKESGNRIFIIDVEALNISSTEIRKKAATGKRINHLVPAAVHEYVQKLHIYGRR
jgi:nicotinate-nucleotide adenylyltransferase